MPTAPKPRLKAPGKSLKEEGQIKIVDLSSGGERSQPKEISVTWKHGLKRDPTGKLTLSPTGKIEKVVFENSRTTDSFEAIREKKQKLEAKNRKRRERKLQEKAAGNK